MAYYCSYLNGIFCHKNYGKNNTTPMEDMGYDACVIVGYRNKVSVFILKI